MTDAPAGRSAAYTILTTGYTGSTGPGVAATVSYVSDAGRHLIFDPGMVASHDDILGPLAELGLGPDDITDVVLSHHHPDNTMNAGLFGRARVHDHRVEYAGDHWTNRDAEGYELTPVAPADPHPGPQPGGHHAAGRDGLGRGRLRRRPVVARGRPGRRPRRPPTATSCAPPASGCSPPRT
ncbi:hypothetical protein GCM10020254_02240 [Streptomyces goshikiensis]